MAVRDGRKGPVANFYVAKVDPNRLRPLRRQIGLIDERLLLGSGVMGKGLGSVPAGAL